MWTKLKSHRLAIIAAILIIHGGFLAQQSQQQIQQQTLTNYQQLSQTLTRQLSLIIGPLLLSQDWVSLNVSLKQLSEEPFLQSARVINNKDETLAQVGTPSALLSSSPIGSSDHPLASLEVSLQEDYLLKESQQQAQSVLIIIAIGHLLLLVFALIFLRTKPMQSTDSRQIAESLEIDSAVAYKPEVITAENASTPPSSEDLNPQEYQTAIETEPAPTQLPMSNKEVRYFVIFINCRQGSSHLLESEEREALLGTYQQLFERVCAIYRGAFSKDEEGNWLAQFPQQILTEDEADLQQKLHCGSNALCAAQLYKSLYRKMNQQRILQMKPVLNLKIGLVAGHEPEPLRALASGLTTRTESNELIIAPELYEFSDLRALLMDEGMVTRAASDCYLIHQLSAEFQQLIDRQAEHFLQESVSA